MSQAKQMDDACIVELYWKRSESAIRESAVKYGDYCRCIAFNILFNREDAEESVNDTWLDAWNNMPPHKPSVLSTFLGKITRRISIDRWRYKHADKRGGGEMPLVLEELEECVSSSADTEKAIEQQEMTAIIRDYLDALSPSERRVFLRRYWYMDSVSAISRDFGFSESKVASLLYRTRQKLRSKLESEGY